MNELEDELSEDEIQQKNAEMLDQYGQALLGELKEAIAWRKPYEQRCLEAENQIRTGKTELNTQKATKDSGGIMNPAVRLHERATDNQTAPLWRKVSAKISQMLFGTDEIQADIEPSPKATAQAFAQQPDPNNPESPSLADIADAAAESMELTIKDYLAEANYARHGRAVIDDGTGVGIGVMHGPFPKLVREKIGITQMADDGTAVSMFELKTKTVPSVTKIDWRCFYPKPCRNMEECEGVFILDLMTKKKMEKLKDDPTFNCEQVCRVLEGETKTSLLLDTPSMTAGGELAPTIKGKYEVWKFFGTIPSKCMGVLHGTEEKEEKDIDAEVWMCNGVVLKAVPRDGEEALPFQTYSFKKDPDSIFGYGVPHVMADDQFDINLFWGQIKLNTIASSMPIVGWDKSLLDPDQGQIDWPPQKPIDFEGGDMSKALQMMTVPSTVADSVMVYDRAKNNAMEHTLVQSVEQDLPAKVDLGASMFAMLKIEQNVITANAAITWDDCITKPLFEAFIDFELYHGTDPKNKGAFDVVPKAATHLLTKDIQIQQAMQAIALAQQPQNAPFYKMYQLNRMVMSRTSLPVDQIMNSEEEANAILQQQAQQPNPEMQKIESQKEIEQMKAANDLEIAKIKAESDQLVAQMKLEGESIKAASDEVATQAEVEVRTRIAQVVAASDAFKERLKDQREREKTAAQTTLEAQKLASKEAGDMLEVKVENTPRLA